MGELISRIETIRIVMNSPLPDDIKFSRCRFDSLAFYFAGQCTFEYLRVGGITGLNIHMPE